ASRGWQVEPELASTGRKRSYDTDSVATTERRNNTASRTNLARNYELLTEETYAVDASFLLAAHGRHFTGFGKGPGQRHHFHDSETRSSGQSQRNSGRSQDGHQGSGGRAYQSGYRRR